MRQRKLGTITIGQAPRPDITPILAAAIDPELPTVQVGLLDGLSRAEIAARFAPRPGGAVLITRLLDGGSVNIDKATAREAIESRIGQLEDEGCTTILLLCTGHFGALACRKAWLIEPDHIVPPAVAALAAGRRVGLIVPLASQIASEADKWACLAAPPLCAAASPYAGDDAAVTEAARQLRAQGAELLAMDCMGFVEHHRRLAAEGFEGPVVLSNALIAKLTAEVL
jgi:protein AroM